RPGAAREAKLRTSVPDLFLSGLEGCFLFREERRPSPSSQILGCFRLVTSGGEKNAVIRRNRRLCQVCRIQLVHCLHCLLIASLFVERESIGRCKNRIPGILL